MSDDHLLFVTGRLAAPALRRVLSELGPQAGFEFDIQVMPISVAALLTTEWLLPRLNLPANATRLILPGYCRGDIRQLSQAIGIPVDLGPKDLRRLPEFFGQANRGHEDYGPSSIEIIAEINHAPQLGLEAVEKLAQTLVADGADVVDLGCNPGETWTEIGNAVQILKSLGLRVSVDSFNPTEIRSAVNAGAELVLSLNSSNCQLAEELDVEWVVIPDEPATLAGLDENVDRLDKLGARYRIDPILEPIGMGFAASLSRYYEVRQRYPGTPMMMGIGNISELTDVDSAGVNTVLLGYCQELAIQSVLTTQVISWAQSSVKECAVARQLVHFACEHGVPPKRLDSRLVMLRDSSVVEPAIEDLSELAVQLKDQNYRLFVAAGQLHLVAAGLHLQADDPFDLFDQLMDRQPRNVDASHAFYLGYELCKGLTALTLGKEYRQDEALSWGLLTRPEHDRHRLRRRKPGTGTGSSHSRDPS